MNGRIATVGLALSKTNIDPLPTGVVDAFKCGIMFCVMYNLNKINLIWVDFYCSMTKYSRSQRF